MRKVCIIPARMGSSRFPGKPLKNVCGIPLVIHIAKRCMLSGSLNSVSVATCDKEIGVACEKHKVPVIMTSTSHERCTDRVSEAIENLNANFSNDDLIIMVQGDEILVEPQMIDLVIEEYEKTRSPVINLLSKIYSPEDFVDPNVVKVVVSPENKALYFSRSPIPSNYRSNIVNSYQQTGVIAFSHEFLLNFSRLDQTPLEKFESIDMLRIIENGIPLKVVKIEKETIAVDVPQDLIRAEKVLLKDPLLKTYA